MSPCVQRYPGRQRLPGGPVCSNSSPCLLFHPERQRLSGGPVRSSMCSCVLFHQGRQRLLGGLVCSNICGCTWSHQLLYSVRRCRHVTLHDRALSSSPVQSHVRFFFFGISCSTLLGVATMQLLIAERCIIPVLRQVAVQKRRVRVESFSFHQDVHVATCSVITVLLP